MMKKLPYQLTIDAPAEHVFKTMLAKETYKQWTAAFNPTSDFEGSWEKGEKIYFVGMNEKGEKEGTDNFAAENEWITSIYSFMKNVPDNCYIQTLEDSELIAINIYELEKCFADFPEMERCFLLPLYERMAT